MLKSGKVLKFILYAIVLFLAVCSILSIFRNTESRYLKMLDFPRIQFFILSLISLLFYIILRTRWRWYNYLVVAGLLCGLAINGSYLIHYTGLVAEAVPSEKTLKAGDVRFSLLLTNVKMDNRETRPLIDLIKLKNPDMVLAMEVNERWDEELKILKKEYPYSQHTINEVAYGMVLYSKLPIDKIEVDYLNNEKVPSFEGVITLADNKRIDLHCIHPVPPTHFKDLPDNEGQPETALKQLGKEIGASKLPTVVAGDLNDVVWSHVDELTGTQGILKDVRVGRGFYNSYNAENFFMKWPLDHIFVTGEIRLKKLERLPKIGSDHYPMYVELVF